MQSHKVRLAGRESEVCKDINQLGALHHLVMEKYEARDVVSWLNYAKEVCGEEEVRAVTEFGRSDFEELVITAIIKGAEIITRQRDTIKEQQDTIQSMKDEHYRRREKAKMIMSKIMQGIERS